MFGVKSKLINNNIIKICKVKTLFLGSWLEHILIHNMPFDLLHYYSASKKVIEFLHPKSEYGIKEIFQNKSFLFSSYVCVMCVHHLYKFVSSSLPSPFVCKWKCWRWNWLLPSARSSISRWRITLQTHILFSKYWGNSCKKNNTIHRL